MRELNWDLRQMVQMPDCQDHLAEFRFAEYQFIDSKPWIPIGWNPGVAPAKAGGHAPVWELCPQAPSEKKSQFVGEKNIIKLIFYILVTLKLTK